MNSRCKHTDCIEVYFSNFWTFYATAGSKRELNYSLLLSGNRFTVPHFLVRSSGSRTYPWKGSLMGSLILVSNVPSLAWGWASNLEAGDGLGRGTAARKIPPPASRPKGFPQVARDFPKGFTWFLKKLVKSCSNKTKPFFGLMLKYANCKTKVRFLSVLYNFAA